MNDLENTLKLHINSKEIDSIKILMDFYPKDDNFGKNTLIITHHPPLFIPKTPNTGKL